MARLAAGKVVVGQQMYNGIVNFVEWLKEKYQLDSAGKILSNGSLSDIILNEGQIASTTIPSNGYGVVADWPVNFNSEYLSVGYQVIKLYNNGKEKASLWQSNDHFFNGSYTLDYVSGTEVRLTAVAIKPSTGTNMTFTTKIRLNEGDITNKLNWSIPENWGEPQPLPQNKEWQGDFNDTPGFAEPPTDLPDFLSRIPVGIADNNLVVTGEIVEAETGGGLPTPSPSPSPSPEYNKGTIGLIIAEILALINSLSGDTAVDPETIEQVAQEVAEQAQTVPDTITQTATQTQEAIQDATQTITETMTQTQTQTQTAIQDATQTITDSQTEIKDAIQDQTQEITDIKDAIQDATDVPTRDKWEQVKKDLHGVFPFCIPWDIYGMLTAFSAEPRAPHFEYPFQIPSIGLDYTLELDFAEFDPVAQILRTVELIAFSIGLAILTSKVIRW